MYTIIIIVSFIVQYMFNNKKTTQLTKQNYLVKTTGVETVRL